MEIVLNNNAKIISNTELIWRQNKINGFISKNLIELLIKNDFKLQISTLGPEGTSSEYASEYFKNLLHIDYKEKPLLRLSYEDAMGDVLNRSAEIVIVANAYQKIDSFYMRSDLKVLASFMCKTPPYGIASKSNDVILGQEKKIDIITHPAPISLIPWFINNTSVEYNIHFISSTSKAAESVMIEQFKYCVTNEQAVNKYNLVFISRTRPIQMLWSVFGLNN